MKYGLGYSLITRTIGFLGRNIFYYKRNEFNYILNLLIDQKGKKILDYGCNSGYFANMIKKAIPENQVFGADINMYALDYARKKYKNIKFYHVNDEFFEKHKFGIIIIGHVLEHIKEREEFIKKILKILSKDGKIIVVVPQEIIRGDKSLPQMIYNFFKFKFENPHVIRLFYQDLKNLFDKNNFKINNKKYINFIPPIRSDSRKFYSGSLVVSASKP